MPLPPRHRLLRVLSRRDLCALRATSASSETASARRRGVQARLCWSYSLWLASTSPFGPWPLSCAAGAWLPAASLTFFVPVVVALQISVTTLARVNVNVSTLNSVSVTLRR